MKSNRYDVRVLAQKVISGFYAGVLENSADPDQTPQNASDQGLHCLLKLQEIKD